MSLQKDHQKEVFPEPEFRKKILFSPEVNSQTLSNQVKNLQEHIKMLEKQTEEQEHEMEHLQEAYESRCQSQKQLEDSLSSARDMIERFGSLIYDISCLVYS